MESNISLELVFNTGQSKTYDFDTYLITVGRSCDRDIVIPLDFISRRHCCIYVNGRGEHVIKDGDLLDTKSKNGVYVNGDRVSLERKIKPGDTVTFLTDSLHPKLIITKAFSTPNEETTATYQD